MARVLVLLFTLWVLAPNPSSQAAEYFRWVDDKGNVHFTDNLHNIPEKSRADVGRYVATENKTPPPAPKTKASIPFEKQGSVVIVDATFNRRTTAKLVVDTGASFTMISSATAKELNFEAAQNQRTAPFQTANGMIQAPLFKLDSITVGGMEIKNLTAAVHDINVDAKVAGLLGLDFLSNFRMDIDTEKGILNLEKR